jgi:recombination protein RecR
MTPDSALERMIHHLAKLPGLGKRSARRVALHLMKQPESLMIPLADSMAQAAIETKKCDICANLSITNPCNICSDSSRDQKTICVVEEVDDLWALERSGMYRGLYHVLGGTLSAIEGRSPESININQLVNRTLNQTVEEVIIATGSTIEGQTTAHYIAERLANQSIKLSRLSQGIPVGGQLDFLDDSTLQTALRARQSLNITHELL